MKTFVLSRNYIHVGNNKYLFFLQDLLPALKGLFDIKNEQLLPSLFTLPIVNDAKALDEAMKVMVITFSSPFPALLSGSTFRTISLANDTLVNLKS